MAKKHKSYPGEPTLDMGFDEMDVVSQQETGPVPVLGMTFSNPKSKPEKSHDNRGKEATEFEAEALSEADGEE